MNRINYPPFKTIEKYSYVEDFVGNNLDDHLHHVGPWYESRRKNMLCTLWYCKSYDHPMAQEWPKEGGFDRHLTLPWRRLYGLGMPRTVYNLYTSHQKTLNKYYNDMCTMYYHALKRRSGRHDQKYVCPVTITWCSDTPRANTITIFSDPIKKTLRFINTPINKYRIAKKVSAPYTPGSISILKRGV